MRGGRSSESFTTTEFLAIAVSWRHHRISGLVTSLAIDTLLAADLPRQSQPLVGELRRYGETRATP